MFDDTGNDIFEIWGKVNSFSGATRLLVRYDTRLNREWKSFANFPLGYDDNGNQLEFKGLTVIRHSSNARVKKIFLLCHSGALSDSEDQLTEPGDSGSATMEADADNMIENPTLIDMANGDKKVEWENPYYSAENSQAEGVVRYLVSVSNEVDEETQDLINPKQTEVEKPITEEISSVVFSAETEGINFERTVFVRVEYDCFCFIRTQDDVIKGYSVPESDGIEKIRQKALATNDDDIIRIFPNPASETLKVEILKDGAESISISDLNGRQIKKSSVLVQKGINTIDVADFPPGVYLLQVKNTDGTVFVRRFVTVKD